MASLWGRRSTTIRGEYMKLVLGSRYTLNEEIGEYFKKFGIDYKKCVYCGDNASALDHLFSPTKDKKFTGYTNDLKNLLPVCSPCNSSKGNLDWKEWINSKRPRACYARGKTNFAKRKKIIEEYIKKNKSNIRPISNEQLLLLNQNCCEFEKEMKRCINRLDAILEQHRDAYIEMQSKDHG